MKAFLESAPRFLFFTGKGGVGKTSMASSAAVGLAELGHRVLLVSTDPASNLDEVFGVPLSSRPTPIDAVPGLDAMNVNPLTAAQEYRERMVAPYRGVLPDAAIEQMEEQLSGACTVEIAGFNEFSQYVGDESRIAGYDHVVLDTAPTGHTLRLLALPSAWNEFIADSQTGSSCLGPVSGLADQKQLYEKVVYSLQNPALTALVLVARPERMSLKEAARASVELGESGMTNQRLILNGVFDSESTDPIASAFSAKSAKALAEMANVLHDLPQTRVPFRPSGVMGVESLKQVCRGEDDDAALIDATQLASERDEILSRVDDWDSFIEELGSSGRGVIMTMGKGGVGKTTMAALTASELANRGHKVLLSTTDPAAHLVEVVGGGAANLEVDRIDPERETATYVDSVVAQNRGVLSDEDMALLQEELRSPCIEEIAVFQAFAKTVAKGTDQIIVLDTAPTGHTLLLLDSSEAYHREVAKSASDLPDEVRHLLPRIRDPEFTKVLMVALPEATPVHEAEALQDDLRRAGIEPFGWIVNRCFAIAGSEDPILCTKGGQELPHVAEVTSTLAKRCVVSSWLPDDLNELEQLKKLKCQLGDYGYEPERSPICC